MKKYTVILFLLGLCNFVQASCFGNGSGDLSPFSNSVFSSPLSSQLRSARKYLDYGSSYQMPEAVATSAAAAIPVVHNSFATLFAQRGVASPAKKRRQQTAEQLPLKMSTAQNMGQSTLVPVSPKPKAAQCFFSEQPSVSTESDSKDAVEIFSQKLQARYEDRNNYLKTFLGIDMHNADKQYDLFYKLELLYQKLVVAQKMRDLYGGLRSRRKVLISAEECTSFLDEIKVEQADVLKVEKLLSNEDCETKIVFPLISKDDVARSLLEEKIIPELQEKMRHAIDVHNKRVMAKKV